MFLQESKESKPTDSKSTEKKDGDLAAKVASVDVTDQPKAVRLYVAEALAERKSLLSRWIVDSRSRSTKESLAGRRMVHSRNRVWTTPFGHDAELSGNLICLVSHKTRLSYQLHG